MNEEILDKLLSQSKDILIINFWEKCTDASTFMNVVMEELEVVFQYKKITANIIKLNLCENREWAMKYDIQGTPSIVVVREQKVVTTLRGRLNLTALIKELSLSGIIDE